MKLWKVHIKDYRFGVVYYDLFVLADTVQNIYSVVWDYRPYRDSLDSEIVHYEEIPLEGADRIL